MNLTFAALQFYAKLGVDEDFYILYINSFAELCPPLFSVVLRGLN